MTVVDLAVSSGVNRTHIQKILRGEVDSPSPTRETLKKLADALRCEIEDLTSVDAIERLNPYDSNPRVRAIVDRLLAMPAADRDRWLDTLDWMTTGWGSAVVYTLPRGDPSLRVADAPDNVVPFHQETLREMTNEELRELTRVLDGLADVRGVKIGDEYEVPLLGAVSAGDGIEVYEIADEKRLIPGHYYRKGARAVFKAKGTSMHDVGIWDNDILFVKPTPHAKNGSIVICTLNNKAFVKVFQKDRNQLRLFSKNDGYAPIDIGPDDDFQIYGVVLGRTGDL